MDKVVAYLLRAKEKLNYLFDPPTNENTTAYKTWDKENLLLSHGC